MENNDKKENKNGPKNSGPIYRRYNRIRKSILRLFEKELIKKSELDELLNRAEILRDDWLREFKEVRSISSRSRGRPKATDDRELFTQCKRKGCTNSPAKGQAYCSRECAPFAKQLSHSESNKSRAA